MMTIGLTIRGGVGASRSVTRPPRRAGRRVVAAAVALLTGLAMVLVPSGAAQAHRERPAQFPSGAGSVPTYRTGGPYLVVCAADTPERIAGLPKPLRKLNQQLYAECVRDGFRSIQAAVDAVATRGSRILIQPGVYNERPSLAPLSPECAAIDESDVISYEQQVACPHLQNLITILGDGPDPGIACDDRLCDLQVEGTGATPQDVVVDGRFQRHVVIRADRADGIYFRNFSVQHAHEFALYILETDGFVIDDMVGRWNTSYGFLTFADDHGLYKDCEAYGNGDGGLYPGAASPHYGARHSIEITRCNSHHNWAGLSGTAGNSLWVHDNDFHDNSVGVALDSLFPNHPGMPQGYSRFTGNRIFSNNTDYYDNWRDGTCFLPEPQRGYDEGVVCPQGPAPTGTGILLAGGNANEFSGNQIWDNWRTGAMQFFVPAVLRGDLDPDKQLDTSHYNQYVGNTMGRAPDGSTKPNGVDFWWDGEGIGNCWQANTSPSGAVTSDPSVLPDCSAPPVFTPPDPVKVQALLACLGWAPNNLDPDGCAWVQPPAPPT